MKTHYRFTVTYQTQHMRDTCNFLDMCDLNVGQVCIEQVYEFDYTKEPKPIEYFKRLFTQAFESIDCFLVDVRGGIVE